jgi:hypothetical protein
MVNMSWLKSLHNILMGSRIHRFHQYVSTLGYNKFHSYHKILRNKSRIQYYKIYMYRLSHLHSEYLGMGLHIVHHLRDRIHWRYHIMYNYK